MAMYKVRGFNYLTDEWFECGKYDTYEDALAYIDIQRGRVCKFVVYEFKPAWVPVYSTGN